MVLGTTTGGKVSENETFYTGRSFVKGRPTYNHCEQQHEDDKFEVPHQHTKWKDF